MAEYIDLNNTEVLAEAGENAKLVVEEDGELKRILASAVGGSDSGVVKNVNGKEPDAGGRIDLRYDELGGLPFFETYNYVEVVTGAQVAIKYISIAGSYQGQYRFEDTFIPLIAGSIYTVVWNGQRLTDITATENHLGQPMLTLVFDGPTTNYVYITSDSTNEVYNIEGFEVGTFELTIDRRTLFVKPLDAKFLPATVPVIQSATVGQTVVVKAVDESGKPTEWEAVDVSAGGGAMIVRFTAESDSTVVSDTDIATVCEAMEAGRAVMGYLSPGGATFLVSNPVEYIAPRLDTAGMIKFRFAIMDTATSMQVIDLKITDRGVEMQQYAIGSTT